VLDFDFVDFSLDFVFNFRPSLLCLPFTEKQFEHFQPKQQQFELNNCSSGEQHPQKCGQKKPTCNCGTRIIIIIIIIIVIVSGLGQAG